jgi:hypothetical protein
MSFMTAAPKADGLIAWVKWQPTRLAAGAWQSGGVMTGSDLIVLAPWLIFAAGLMAVWLRLRKSRRITSHESSPPGPSQPSKQPPGRPAAQSPGQPPPAGAPESLSGSAGPAGRPDQQRTRS